MGASIAELIGVCTVRDGTNCKRCKFYGKVCDTFKHTHNGKKPMLVDENKAKVHKEWFKNG